ncbi:hypothetical protein AJ78_03120 [Emergomyces pasteurianus Ep9510]|uniref:Uncharacterized protein n=1 Tax=Emergomyces pasteurianus Ep9510 TaxID=1447872 RepID=A0A1J9QNB7_9EURO|nr:hypothetical protein AJ78_03120 [Emergomyces pasteurianus Ep9510]
MSSKIRDRCFIRVSFPIALKYSPESSFDIAIFSSFTRSAPHYSLPQAAGQTASPQPSQTKARNQKQTFVTPAPSVQGVGTATTARNWAQVFPISSSNINTPAGHILVVVPTAIADQFLPQGALPLQHQV